jgi:hypothetical protein
MKKLLILSAGPAYLLLLAGFTCSRPDTGTGKAQAFFWKKTDSAVTHYLYIDNTEKGVLPFLSAALTTPGSDIAQRQGLSLNLKTGDYDIMVKDKNGNILCNGTLLLKRSKGSEEIKSSWNNSNCSVEVVFE